MLLHMLRVVAFLSAAHQVQGIKVTASASNLGAPASDAEAAASLEDPFLRSSASAQHLLAAKEPVQLDDVAHGQESLVALSGDSPSSDAEAAASLKGRFLRSSASAQDLLAAKEPAQLDDISHGQESLVALSGDSPSSDVEAAAYPAADVDVEFGVRSLYEKVEVQEEQGLPVEEARVHREASLRGSDEKVEVQEASRVPVEEGQVCRAELRLTPEKEEMQCKCPNMRPG